MAVHNQDGSGMRHRVAAAWWSLGVSGRVVATGGLAGCAMVSLAWPPTSVAAGLALAVIVLAAVVDVAEHRLPNALVAMAATPVLLALVVSTSSDLVRSSLTGAALFGGPLLAAHVVSPAGMGFGDVKAGTVVGAALGLLNAEVAVLALLLGLLGSAVWAAARKRSSVALGPGLVAGALAALGSAGLLGAPEVSP